MNELINLKKRELARMKEIEVVAVDDTKKWFCENNKETTESLL